MGLSGTVPADVDGSGMESLGAASFFTNPYFYGLISRGTLASLPFHLPNASPNPQAVPSGGEIFQKQKQRG